METHFLFVEDILKDSTSANAETIFNILIRKLDHYGLQLQKLSSMASDGAAVMVGEQSGVAAHLKEVNNRVITFHCLCHKLAWCYLFLVLFGFRNCQLFYFGGKGD